ncbi:MAG: cyclic nucleotide-binding domain-containing protein [Actinomycetota bacterium]
MFWTNKTANHAVPHAAHEALSGAFNDHELRVLSGLATLVDVPAGTSLTSQGTAGRQAVVVVSGTASVLRDNNVIATVGAGDLIGEMSLLTGEPRNATVVADTELSVYALSPREFSSLLSQCPRLAQSITATAVKRLSEVATA